MSLALIEYENEEDGIFIEFENACQLQMKYGKI